jgi:hypothetical protein
MVPPSHYIHLWRSFCSFWIYHFLNLSYYVGCEHLCQSIIEVLLFDEWIFISTIITYIFLLSLINARCFRMCQVLGVHLFEIRHHWSFFCLVFYFLFYLMGVSPWAFLSNIYNFFFGFFHLPTLSFGRMPHFLLFNNLCKGSIQLSFWEIRHGHFISLEIMSKIKCNIVFFSCIKLSVIIY